MVCLFLVLPYGSMVNSFTRSPSLTKNTCLLQSPGYSSNGEFMHSMFFAVNWPKKEGGAVNVAF